MNILALKTVSRDVLGKKVRFLRRQGITPVHLFGHSIESLALQCDTAELKHILAQAGTTRLINLKIENEKQARSVFIREIQKDAVNLQLLHVDLYQVRKDEKMEANVPIILVGQAPALKEKGRVLSHGITSLSVVCLPDDMPPQIEIDISHLEELEQAIHLRDIVLNPNITVKDDPDQMIAKISEVHVEKEEEAVAAEVEEGEAPTGEASTGEAPPEEAVTE